MRFNQEFLAIISIVVLGSLSFCEGKFKYNVSLLEMATCKDYDIRNAGYKYSEFFHVNSMKNNKVASGELLHLKFYVLTSMDAHILLSVTQHPRWSDRVYEIVIGAGGNTFSAIRTSMGRQRVATNQDLNLLFVLDPTPIEIVQMKDGNLLVYIPGFKNEPILKFTDPSPLNINYVSFSTFGSISAQWFFDCRFDGFESELEEEIRPMTPREHLIANLTAWSENASLPANLSSVDFTLQIRSVSYQQDSSILKTRINMLMSWRDTRLEWYPEEFNGIDTFVDSNIDIWTPTLIVLNGAYKNLGAMKPKGELKIHDNGTVLLIARDIEITTWCFNPSRNWPNEVIRCEIALGLHEFDTMRGIGQLTLNYMNTNPLEHENFATYSEWDFKHITVSSFANSVLARYTSNSILQTMEGDISVELTISRNSYFYKNVFIMPILTTHSLLIMSFMLRGYRRGALILVTVIILALGLIFLTLHANPSYVPAIMVAYEYNIFIAVLCYIVHIDIMWLELFPPKKGPSSWLMCLVNSSPLRLVLCMRFEDSTEYINIQQNPWRDVAKMLNNLSLIVALIAFVIINVCLLPQS